MNDFYYWSKPKGSVCWINFDGTDVHFCSFGIMVSLTIYTGIGHSENKSSSQSIVESHFLSTLILTIKCFLF